MIGSTRRTPLFRRALPLAAAALIAPLVGACGVFSDEPGEEKQIAAAFYPLAWVSEQVAGEHYDVVSLTRPGGEPHDLELTPKETAMVADSGVVVFESDFQPAVDAAVETNATGKVIDAAKVVELKPFGAEEEHSEEGHSEEGHEHEEEEHSDGGEAEEGHGHEGHDHGEFDPHFWLDPIRMAELGDAVADTLADLDPDNAQDYQENAADLRTSLEKLDWDYLTGLDNCERNLIVTNHDAFGYLAKYGIRLESIVGITPDAEPTPADRKHLREIIREEKITTVFAESLGSSKKAATTLSDDLGLQLAELDPIEGLSEETEGEDYLSLMRRNLSALTKANGC